MSECVCEGNWRDIINEVDHLIGQVFVDDREEVWRFSGVLWAEDDYYYMFYDKYRNRYKFVTCVMSFEQVIKFEELEKIND